MLAGFTTAFIAAVSGMAGGSILLAFLTFGLPLQVVIPIHGASQVTANFSRLAYLRQHIKANFFWPFIIGMPIGVFISYYLIERMSKLLPLAILAALLAYVIFRPKRLPEVKIPDKGFFLLGIVVGIFSLLIGTVGPLIAPFLLRSDLEKKEIVATKASFQLFTHLLKFPAFVALGFDYIKYALPIVCLSLFIVLGTRVGIGILDKVPDKLFNWIYKGMLFIALTRIVYKIFKTGLTH